MKSPEELERWESGEGLIAAEDLETTEVKIRKIMVIIKAVEETHYKQQDDYRIYCINPRGLATWPPWTKTRKILSFGKKANIDTILIAEYNTNYEHIMARNAIKHITGKYLGRESRCTTSTCATT